MQKKEEDDDDGEDVQKKNEKKKQGISLELSEARNNLKNENPNETKRKTNFAARRGCKINEGATGRVRSGGAGAGPGPEIGIGIAPGLKDSELCCAVLCAG